MSHVLHLLWYPLCVAHTGESTLRRHACHRVTDAAWNRQSGHPDHGVQVYLPQQLASARQGGWVAPRRRRWVTLCGNGRDLVSTWPRTRTIGPFVKSPRLSLDHVR
jgi:hypothetical protein